MQKDSILFLDIETSELEANRGHILCASAKFAGSKKIYTWRIDDNVNYGTTPKSWSDDSRIVRALRGICERAKVVVAYYGGYGKFDIPFINTRLLANDLQPLPQLSVVDPYTTAKSKLRLSRYSLASVSGVLKCKHRKSYLPWDDWMLSKVGDRKAMDNLLRYNKNDVLVLEEVYYKLLPLMNTHPFTAKPTKDKSLCPVCGARSISRGYRTTRLTKFNRRQCVRCNHYFSQGVKI